jgi:microsomal dipeptidase-like Zn-dependent dipeptidase
MAAMALQGCAQNARAEPTLGLANPGLANPSFERGLEGWTKTGTAFDSQPTYLENVNGSRVNPITVGGDYWKDIPFPIGIRGDYWIGTFDDRPTARAMRGQVQGDGPTGTLTSVAFLIPEETKFISFLIGGGEDLGGLKIELLEAIGRDYRPAPGIAPQTGLGSELLRRDWWNVTALDKSKAYVIRLTDDAPVGHINIDDIRFEKSEPAKATLADGRPSLLRTSIKGRAVWTDYDAKLWGAADLHTHPMSHLSMGGKLMHGMPDVGSLAPPGTIKEGNGCNQREVRTTFIDQALPDCSATHGGWGIDNTCGDSIRAAVINLIYDQEFIHKIKLPHKATCEPGMSMEGGLCYPPCNAGFHSFGTLCVRDCPAGFRDDGLACGKLATGYLRGVGYLLQNDDQGACQRDNPQGCEKVGLIWYPRCKAGFHGIGPLCTEDCPAGFGDIGAFCSKPAPYLRGVGYLFNNEKTRCERDNPQGCEQCGAPWFPNCRAGFHGFLCNTCVPDCPAGMTDLNPLCQKNSDYGRGNGYLGHTDDKGACERDNPQGCERCGAPFFPKCKPGFHELLCNTCSPDCPAGMMDIGLACTKDRTYNRGIGKLPLLNAHGDHQHAGWPAMAYWPHSSTAAHQQMYVDWIKRAHEGGLNVLVALAVNNELLGEVMNGSPPKDDKASADKQLDEIRSFIGRHGDFMKEVQSAADFRQAVKEGKLAVIVGLEVDNIGNFNVGNPALLADETAVKREIQRLYHDKGVRYIFPLHFADNVFGGPAVSGVLFNLSNRFARTRPLPIGVPYPPGFLHKVETASDPSINYRLAFFGGEGEWAHGLTLTTAKTLVDTLGATPFPPAFDAFKCPVPRLGCVPQFALLSSLLSPDSEWDRYQFVAGGQVNQRGLTPIGEVAIKEMMRLGMIIDIDHMSEKAANRTLEIAESFKYPVNSGHTGFRHKPGQKVVHEGLRSPAQLTRLGALGGMMGVGWAHGDASSYLESYRFGLQHGGTERCTPDRRPNRRTCAPITPPAFSLGSDINGFERMPGPRQGSAVMYCNAGIRCPTNTMRQYSFGTNADGTPRLWDYNKEGVAHIGLYPDIYQDLKNLGMTEQERTAFFGAADAFARMWDKIEVQKSTVR